MKKYKFHQRGLLLESRSFAMKEKKAKGYKDQKTIGGGIHLETSFKSYHLSFLKYLQSYHISVLHSYKFKRLHFRV